MNHQATESRSFEPFAAYAIATPYYACIIVNFTDLFATFINLMLHQRFLMCIRERKHAPT